MQIGNASNRQQHDQQGEKKNFSVRHSTIKKLNHRIVSYKLRQKRLNLKQFKRKQNQQPDV